jgi:hypothetical protein
MLYNVQRQNIVHLAEVAVEIILLNIDFDAFLGVFPRLGPDL